MSVELKLDFPAIQTRYTEKEIKEIANAIRNAKTLSMGPYLKAFEEQFAAYLNVKHAVGVVNASSALELAVMLLDIREGDEVILPAHTFTSTALPFLRRKVRIVFADIDPDTWVMDVEDAEKKISSKTRVIVPVHLYGLPVQMDKLKSLAESHGLFIIEDCAQSPGAEFNGKKVGVFGHVGCFSFHGQKNITTLGEGGMIVTNSDDFAEKILGLRKIGQRPYKTQTKYWLPAMTNVIEAIPSMVPFNFALSEIQAYAGSLLLKRLDKNNEKRRKIRNQIYQALTHHPELVFQKFPSNCTSACHLLPACFKGESFKKTRDDLIELLYTEYGIKSVIQYYPLYRYELFQKHGYISAECPRTDHFFDHMVSFPFGSDLTDREVNYLIDSIDAAIYKLKG